MNKQTNANHIAGDKKWMIKNKIKYKKHKQ
jgi:hypothetical protein